MLDFLNRIKSVIWDEIGEPPWNYYFLQNLDEKEYPRYLAKLFKLNTGENLPLKYDFRSQAWVIDKKRCKTFNQKIQWIKLYGVTDLMRMCTDKVAVRDYVKEKIGEEYLKPVLQIIPAPIEEPRHSEPNDNLEGEESRPTKEEVNIQRPCDTSASNGCPPQYDGKTNDVSTYFDQIQWDKLPNAFVIKCNHGCKWHYIIKNKEQFLNTPQLFETVKRNITGWLEQEYCFWGGFEMQYATSRRVLCREKGNPKLRFLRGKNYLPDTKRIIEPTGEINEPVCSNKYGLRKGCQEKGIEPKILIEPLMCDDINKSPQEIQVYCFSGMPKYIIKFNHDDESTIYNENLKIIDDVLSVGDTKIVEDADNNIKQSIDLSKQQVEGFDFVRVDWMLYKNKLYFEEMTFTPYSGMHRALKKEFAKKFGKLIK